MENTNHAQSQARVAALVREIEARVSELRAIAAEPLSIRLSALVDIELDTPQGDNRILIGRKGWGFTVVNYTSEGCIVDVCEQGGGESVRTICVGSDELVADESEAPLAPPLGANDDLRGYAWALVKDDRVIRSGSLPAPQFCPEGPDTKQSHYRAMAHQAGADLYVGGYPDATDFQPAEGLIFGMTWNELNARQQRQPASDPRPQGRMPSGAVLAYSPQAATATAHA